MNKRTLVIAQTGMMSALAVAISAIEMLVPVTSFLPPGCRIGFSNVATMLAARNISAFSAFAVTVVKSLFVFATRGFTAFLLSLAGGVASTLLCVMLLRGKRKKFGYIGVGVSGAAAHNLAQLAVYSVLAGQSIWYYAPILLAFGTVSGALTGVLFFLLPQSLFMKKE